MNTQELNETYAEVSDFLKEVVDDFYMVNMISEKQRDELESYVKKHY